MYPAMGYVSSVSANDLQLPEEATPPNLLRTPIGRLRVIAFVEGCSFLLLLGVAMPLKYFFGMPVAVRVVGSIHGGLFVFFCAALLHVMFAERWSLWRGMAVFASSLAPFGTFMMDPSLRREQAARQNPAVARGAISPTAV
jgi:integral membrane protein